MFVYMQSIAILNWKIHITSIIVAVFGAGWENQSDRQLMFVDSGSWSWDACTLTLCFPVLKMNAEKRNQGKGDRSAFNALWGGLVGGVRRQGHLENKVCGCFTSFSHSELSKDKYCRRILYLPAPPKKGFRSWLYLEGCQGGHSCGTRGFSLNCTCQLPVGELS